MSLDAYLARAALADKATSFTDSFKAGHDFINKMQEQERERQARGMLTGSDEDFTLANLSSIAAKNPELAKTMMAMRSADSTASYYDRGGRSTQLTPAQKDKKDLAKIKVNKATELKAIGGAGLNEYMQGRFGHIAESTGFLGFGDDVSILKGADLSTKPKVRRFITTNKKKLFPEGVPKSQGMSREIKAVMKSYDDAVTAGANAMLYQPEVAESTTSTPSSPLRNRTLSEVGLSASMPPLSPLTTVTPMTMEEEKARTQDIVSQLTDIKSAVGGDQPKFIQRAKPLLQDIEREIAAKYQGNPELIRRYVEGVHEIFNKFAVT